METRRGGQPLLLTRFVQRPYKNPTLGGGPATYFAEAGVSRPHKRELIS